MNVDRIADALERRARQCRMVVEDFDDNRLEEVEHGRESFEGKQAGYEAAARELRDHADRTEAEA